MASWGYTTGGGTRLSTSRHMHYRIQVNETGDIDAIWGYLDTNTVARNVQGAIYDTSAQDLTGTPSDRLALATEVSKTITNGSPEWVELAFATPYAVTSGDYIHGSTGTDSTSAWGFHYDDNAGDDNQIESTANSVNSMADPADISGPNTDWDASTYVVVSGAAGNPYYYYAQQ